MSIIKTQTIKTIKTMKTIKLLAILFISSLVFVGCSSDDDDHDHDHDHEHEEVNTVRYTLTNDNDGNDVVTFTFKDLDGEGGADGTFEISGPLTANADYTGVLQLLHEHEDGDIDDIGAEIAEDEADEHEMFYTTNIAGLSFDTTDVDGDGNPLGFETEITTGAAGIGSLTISVIHEGKKPNDGTISDALSAAGTTDIEITFSISVQ